MPSDQRNDYVSIALATLGAVALAFFAGQYTARQSAEVGALAERFRVVQEIEKQITADKRNTEGIVDGHRAVIGALGERLRAGMVAKPPRANPPVPATVDPPPAAGADGAAAGLVAPGELAAARQQYADLAADYRTLSEACGKVAVDLKFLQQWAVPAN